MRGSFNDTFTARYGSRSVVGPPGVVYAVGVSCRFVPQRKIDQGQFDFTLAEAWFTNGTTTLNGPFTSSPWLGAYFTDQLAADEVEFTSRPGVWWSVCKEELVVPHSEPAYWRYGLILLDQIQYPIWPPPESPPPAPPPPGPVPIPPGLTCADAVALPGFGEYVLESGDFGTSGWYYIEVEPGTQVRLRFPEDRPDEWRVDGWATASGETCCEGDWMGAIGSVGNPCVSTNGPEYFGSPGRVCIQVSRAFLLTPPVTVTLFIEEDICP